MCNQALKIFILIVMLLVVFCVDARDPTRPAKYGANNTNMAGENVVSGIFGSNNKRFAVINGKNYSVGDKLGQFYVKTISHEAVQLEDKKGNSKSLPVGGRASFMKVKVSGK